jgi:chaperonin GroEL
VSPSGGLEGSVVVNDVRQAKQGHGLTAAIGEIVDLVAAGVIDPAMVTRCALQNAASIAKYTAPPRRSSPRSQTRNPAVPDMSGMM